MNHIVWWYIYQQGYGNISGHCFSDDISDGFQCFSVKWLTHDCCLFWLICSLQSDDKSEQ